MQVQGMKLEIGVGGGSYVFSPKVQGGEVIYADVERPKKKTKNFVVCDAQFLPFINNVFAEVIASHLIEHLQRPRLFVKESYRTLTGAGKIHIWCPNFLNLNATIDPSHRHVFNIFSLRKILHTCGFKHVDHYPNVGSKIPKPYRFIAVVIFLLLCNDLYAKGVK